MPLIRSAQYSSTELYDYHQRNNWFQADAIRTWFDGRFVSLRAPHMRDSVVTRSLKELAEDEVVIDNNLISRYAAAQTMIGLEMSKLFRAVNKIGVLPQHSSVAIPVIWNQEQAKDITSERISDLVFYPVAAGYAASSNYILFRVIRKEDVKHEPQLQIFTRHSAGFIGLCRETIARLSKELHDYVSTIESKAVMTPDCAQALNDLNTCLRPLESKAREFKEKQIVYGSHFGTWG